MFHTLLRLTALSELVLGFTLNTPIKRLHVCITYTHMRAADGSDAPEAAADVLWLVRKGLKKRAQRRTGNWHTITGFTHHAVVL